MRFLIPLIAVACTLLSSCSSSNLAKVKDTFQRDTIGGYTRADIANLRMRDINPLAKAPPVVQVRQSTLQEIPRERMAFLKRGFSWFGRKPVDYRPPSLPDGTLAFDGGLLPSKRGNHGPALASADPATELEEEENFSIE